MIHSGSISYYEPVIRDPFSTSRYTAANLPPTRQHGARAVMYDSHLLRCCALCGSELVNKWGPAEDDEDYRPPPNIDNDDHLVCDCGESD